MKKLIIFDLDGTLLDTIEDITNSVNETLKYFSYPPRTTDEVKYFLGYGPRVLLDKSFNKTLSDEEFKEAFEYYDKRYSLNSKVYTKPYSGIVKLLKELKANYKLAVCSNKQDNVTKQLMEEIFPNTFDYVIGTGIVEKKPSPAMPLLILKELKIKASETLFIGDTQVDVMTGINANIDVVAVLWGFRKKEDLISLKPKYFIEKPDQLLEILK